MASDGTLIQCAKCRKSLTEAQRVASHTCPKCKHRGTNAVSSVDVIFVYRWERSKWYKFWRRWFR